MASLAQLKKRANERVGYDGTASFVHGDNRQGGRQQLFARPRI